MNLICKGILLCKYVEEISHGGKMIEKLGEISILRVMTSAFLSKCQVVQYFPLQCEPVKGSIDFSMIIRSKDKVEKQNQVEDQLFHFN